VPAGRSYDWGLGRDMPALPDHWDVIERADEAHPFRLATSPARDYLKLLLQRDADQPGQGRAAARQGASVRPRDVGHCRRCARAHGQ
jgi:hypothetical protein